MRSMEFSGHSVDEAIFNGLTEMGVTIDEVEIETIQSESKGLFGIGAKQAVVGKSFLLKADDAQGLRRVLGEGAALAALEAQPLDVHVGDGEGALPGKTLILREHAPVFIDARIAGEHEIGGRFAIARARIEVAAQASRAFAKIAPDKSKKYLDQAKKATS